MPGRHPFQLVAFVLAAAIAGCGEKTTTQPSCNYSVSGLTQTFSASGGAGSLSIGTPAGCSWTVVTDSSWVTIGTANGTGPATIPVAVSSNDTVAARKATLTVAGQAIPVNQDGRTPCEYNVSPSSLEALASGGAATLTVSAAAGCGWTAASPDGWVTVGPPSSGSGNGTIGLAIQTNGATAERATTLTVAGRPVVVHQAAATPNPPQPVCEYRVSPVDTVVHWHATGVTLDIAASPGCPWTIATSENWLSVDRSTGTGSATIAVSFPQYTEDSTRRGAVQVRWPTPTAGQNSWVAQEGCRYGVAPGQSFPAAGGTAMVTVVTQPVSSSCSIGCPWTAVANAAWIRITSSMPRAGDDMFRYEVDPNSGPARVGTITVAGKTHTVSQAGS